MRYFDNFTHPLSVCLAEILPDETASTLQARRAVYRGLIQALPNQLPEAVRVLVESQLRPIRLRALESHLATEDLEELIRIFSFFQADFEIRFEAFSRYKTVKWVAASIAMILFVDHLRQEGFERICSGADVTTRALTQEIKLVYANKAVAIDEDTARFYAAYFVWQTLFDSCFVRQEDADAYDGNFARHRSLHYIDDTRYLELANARLVKASDAERRLSYLITTGWGAGIDVATWNALNEDYYSRSEDNFFSADYDEQLDRMLPQFPWSKARAAETLVAEWSGRTPLNVIEIGAGSGSFAIDLFMALRRQDKPVNLFSYAGVEPSQAMRAVFAEHFQKQTQLSCPSHWRMEPGGLESFLANPRLLSTDATNVMVFSFSVHHCFHGSVASLLGRHDIQAAVDQLYILDGTREHGWTKWTYMPLDCRSPENFDNVAVTGSWHSETLWHEPHEPLPHHAVSTAWAALRRLTPPVQRWLTGEPLGFLIDLDGTLYRGWDVIPGAVSLIQTLQQKGWPFLLMTNRSERTPSQIAEHLGEIGFEGIQPELIYTSATATAEKLQAGRVHLIGGPGLHAAFDRPAFVCDDVAPEYVVLGLDQTLDYARLSKATDLIMRGAKLVATNADKRMNLEKQFSPGNGAIMALLETATGVQAEVIGKPGPLMFEAGIQRLGLPASRVVVIGDSLATDIRGGQDLGLKTVLCLTGVTSQADLERQLLQPDSQRQLRQPDLVVPDLNHLTRLLG